jgi:serine/threonine protein kinase
MIEVAGYRVHEQINESQDALVFRGTRSSDRSPVVLKLLRMEHPTPRDIARLRHEYAIMNTLQGEGIARVLGLHKRGNGLALVMEDRGDLPLSELLRSGRLPLGRVLRLATALTSALAAVHRHLVVHKDVKPSNVLVRQDPLEVRLIDFGVATRLSRESQGGRAAAESLEGTLAYISPEQTGRTNRTVDARSDLYSLGVVLYEALTGTLPFQSAHTMELVHSHIARVPNAPCDLDSRVPRIVSDIVMKLLSKGPEDRYQSARGLEADLAECLRQHENGGFIEPFPLGRHDFSSELRIQQKLYGRDTEIATLFTAFERASQGTVELFLISGHSGIGKSALVNEIHRRGGTRRLLRLRKI